jgi:hypothetical protein
MPREEQKRKRPKQHIQRPKQDREHVPGPRKDTPKSSARPIEKQTRENLTLFDWMTVYAHVEGEVVNYFATRPEGSLSFSRATLSHKLKHRSDIEAHVGSNPNALSSKRPRIVTRPDVDHELWRWVQQMEQKREVVNSAMLIAKWGVIEETLDIPQDERLPGSGWVQSFCHA